MASTSPRFSHIWHLYLGLKPCIPYLRPYCTQTWTLSVPSFETSRTRLRTTWVWTTASFPALATRRSSWGGRRSGSTSSQPTWKSSHSPAIQALRQETTTEGTCIVVMELKTWGTMTWLISSSNQRHLQTLTLQTDTSKQRKLDFMRSILNMLSWLWVVNGFLKTTTNTTWHRWQWSRKGRWSISRLPMIEMPWAPHWPSTSWNKCLTIVYSLILINIWWLAVWKLYRVKHMPLVVSIPATTYCFFSEINGSGQGRGHNYIQDCS